MTFSFRLHIFIKIIKIDNETEILFISYTYMSSLNSALPSSYISSNDIKHYFATNTTNNAY
jgi:hypothetical protein